MIELTLKSGEQLFVNPRHIVGIASTEEEETEVICVGEIVFVVKESPKEIILNLAHLSQTL